MKLNCFQGNNVTVLRVANWADEGNFPKLENLLYYISVAEGYQSKGRICVTDMYVGRSEYILKFIMNNNNIIYNK